MKEYKIFALTCQVHPFFDIRVSHPLGMMHRNIIGIIFLFLISGMTLWFTYQAFTGLLIYNSYKTSEKASILSWKVLETKSDIYRTQAQFAYKYKDHNFEGHDFVGKEFQNPWAAESALEIYSKQEYIVWFNPKNPAKAILEKKFPYKALLSLGIMASILLYFLFLGRSVFKNYGK